MATSTDTTAPAKKSNTMMYAAIAIIIIIVAGVGAYFAFFSGGQSPPTPTVTITLHANGASGWNNTTTPNPTIRIKLSDTVRVHLISQDGGTHNFVIAYDNATTPTPSSGDTVSSTFGSSATASNPYDFTFTPSKAGYFKYYCQYHNTVMIGTIVISSS